MNRQAKCHKGRLQWAVAAIVLGAMSLAAPSTAQSGVVFGAGEELLHLLDNSGNVAVDFNVDDLNTTQQIIFGRADLAGFDEMNIDLVLVDNDSTLDAHDPSIVLDSSDAAIRLGSGSAAQPGRDGDLFIEDGFGFTTFQIEGNNGNTRIDGLIGDLLMFGDSGNILQVLDNLGTQTDFFGNGAVKAWAVIDPAGNVARCWRCNTDPVQTMRLSVGRYQVDFNALGSIDNRPVLAINSCAEPGNPLNPSNQCSVIGGRVFVSPRLGSSSAFYVGINDENGVGIDNGFTIVVF